MAKNKDSRSFNWHPDEIALLAELYEEYATILDSKLTNVVTNVKKNEVYENMKRVLKSAFPKYNRKVDAIKKKLKSAKCEARALSNNQKSEMMQTGGGKCSIKRNIMHEKMISFNKNVPSFSGGIIGGIESDIILSPTASSSISSTSSPLFDKQPSTIYHQADLFKTAKSPKKSRKTIARSPENLQKKVAKMKSSTASLGQHDYFKQVQIEVLKLEKERLHLDIDKIRGERELLKAKKEYLDRKLEKL